jgi:two-component system, chemotaxis family, sensor kinase CheA
MVDENFKEAFISEAREHLDNLNDGVLNLEKEPENEDFVNQVFRACHTLKGNSAMMGYQNFSDLAHKMENLLSKVRDKERIADKDIVDILFEGIDYLESGLDSINKKNIDDLNAAELMERIEKLVNSGGASHISHSIEIKAKFEPNDAEKAKIDAAVGNGLSLFRVVVLFNPNSPMIGPKTQILMRKAKGIIDEVIYSNPSYSEIESGNIEDGFEVVVSTQKELEDLKKMMNSVSEIHSTVLTLDEEYHDGHKPQTFVQSKPGSAAKKDVTKVYDKKIQSIKVDVQKLDILVNLVGELLISNMRMKQVSKEMTNSSLNEVISNIDRLTISIQDAVLQQRMVECGQIFSRYPRLVRDISNKLGKKINLIIEGADIELDRTVLDEIGEPLIHIIRNSIDHGIEGPDERLNNGKKEEGTINLTAKREKNHAVIEIKDDGYGIDVEKVVAKALKNGVITEKELQTMNERQKLKLVFKPGLSTKEQVSELSGRGVGMDVVLTKLKKLGGDVKISSELGIGTTVQMQLPLTLAIITSLIVNVSDEKYAIPLSHVLDTANIKHNQIKTIQGNEVIILRKEDIPIVRLDKFFNKPINTKEEYNLVITERGEQKVGFIVDNIIAQQPILIKNLHPLIQGVKGIAGASILGDGRVCLILDTQNIS